MDELGVHHRVKIALDYVFAPSQVLGELVVGGQHLTLVDLAEHAGVVAYVEELPLFSFVICFSISNPLLGA